MSERCANRCGCSRFLSLAREAAEKGPRAHRRVGAFTVIEMLVVITVIVILVLLAVPSLQAMIRSSEEALAESQLKQAIRVGRDMAVRSSGGNDSALVFFFGTDGRLTIVPCVRAGVITDTADPTQDITAGGTATVQREVFVPAPQAQAVTLPKYWTVRGEVDAARLGTTQASTGDWYATSIASLKTNGYTDVNSTSGDVTNWVFPETALFDPNQKDQGPRRNTFMLRFQGSTGMLLSTPAQPVLVLAAGMSAPTRNSSGAPFAAFDPTRMDGLSYVRQVMSGRAIGSATMISAADKLRLIGRVSTDMVMAGPVSQIALVNERDLASAFGVRLDSSFPALIASKALLGADSSTYTADFVSDIPPTQTPTNPLTASNINKWIEGNTDLQGGVTPSDHPEAKVYTIDRYTGTPHQLEVQQ